MNAKRAKRQMGNAFVLLLVALILGGLAAIGTRLSATQAQLKQSRATAYALAQAKEALLAYAAAHPSVPGLLPCPDINNTAAYEGSPKVSGNNCSAYIGRLPWKKLGLSDLRDGAGECLWYALSPRFQDAGSHTVANGKAINATVPGALTVQDSTGAAARGSPAVAIVFAPGRVLPGQDRTATASHPICGGNDNAGNYLDTNTSGINNATGNGLSKFSSGIATDAFNDTLIWIDAAELFVAVNRRVVGEIGAALKLYYTSAGALPFAAGNADTGVPIAGLAQGFVPWYELQPPPLIGGLTSNAKNGWYSLITYRRNGPSSATLVLDGKSYDYSFP